MAVRHSQNGYTSYDRSQVMTYLVSDSGRTMTLRKGSPGLLLAHAVLWFDRNIRNIDPGIMDDWSYAERPIRGDDGSDPNNDSNHASGTAADIDATKWPLGVNPEAYLTADEIRRWREHLKLYEGCIRWGGDYIGRKDPMHIEIDRDQATCDRVWAKINQEDPMAADSLAQGVLNQISVVVKDWVIRVLRDEPLVKVGPSITTTVTQQMAYDAQGLALINGKVTGLEEAIKQVAVGQGLDPKLIEEAAARGAQSVVDDLRLVAVRGDSTPEA